MNLKTRRAAIKEARPEQTDEESNVIKIKIKYKKNNEIQRIIEIKIIYYILYLYLPSLMMSTQP